MTEPRNDGASAAVPEGAPTTERKHRDAPEQERERLPTPAVHARSPHSSSCRCSGLRSCARPGRRDPRELPSELVPETFVIAPDGMTAKHVGAVTYAWLTRQIEAAIRAEDAP